MQAKRLLDALMVVVVLAVAAAGSCARDLPAQPMSTDKLMRTSHDLYDQGASARQAFTASRRGESAAALRRQFITADLKALKVLIDNGIPDENSRLQEPPPAVVPDFLPRSGPAYEAALAELRTSFEAHQRHLGLERLWAWRSCLTANIVGYYSNPPYATDELRELAMSILKDAPTVDSLISRVNASIRDREAAMVYSPGAKAALERLARSRQGLAQSGGSTKP